MGVIGVIGTVEYSHAQTILRIPEPNNFPATTGGTTEITMESSTNVYLNSANDRHNNIEKTQIGDFYIQSDTLIKSNPLFSTVTERITCDAEIRSVKALLTETAGRVPNLAVPDNITPQGNDNITAIGIDFNNQTGGGRDTKCTPDPEAPSTKLLFSSKELRITITDKHGKKPYYFSPTENVTQAQPIPPCTSDNFKKNTQTLKGNTKMCYGKNSGDMIIITKRLVGFYGTADSITAPTNPIALDSNIAETIADLKERKIQKELERKKAEEDKKKAEQQEKGYLEFLKRLYLPSL